MLTILRKPSDHEIFPWRYPFALFLPSLAPARPMDRTVISGQTTIVGRYYTWNRDCTSAFGTVKVINQPQHGKIANRLVDDRIGISRRTRVADQCLGKPIKALVVTYTSARGYHGVDTFTLDARIGVCRDLAFHDQGRMSPSAACQADHDPSPDEGPRAACMIARSIWSASADRCSASRANNSLL